MFKKLKEKITEEVKISPQRFVEFTQSVSDRLQNNSTSDDNFFSIGDDDTNTSVDNNSYGFSSVQLVSPSQERTRKSSTSSLASDVSFLPRYEPGSMYHLQSDLDISASEVEDNISTTSSQLGHLSKEQIYSAFQKSQKQYHKYRGRYTDLTRHYKDLEREIVKMKSVLVETQDKAIRRVTELKEQCGLEQKAKAHLEAAMRDEIDEKNYKIKTLQTQIGLLQSDHSLNNLVNVEDTNHSSENLENLTKYLNESRKEIENLNAKIQELKANAIVFQSKEHEYKIKISHLEKEIVQFSEREKENNLNLAQNKMELHNEILLKDTEIANLKRDNETLKQKVESSDEGGKSNTNQKMENLQSQNTKLIEKVESLTQKCNNLESELIKMQTYKIEIDGYKQKLVELQKLNEEQSEASEKKIAQLREDAKKGLLSLDKKIRQKLEVEFSEREQEIRNEFTARLQELSSTTSTTQELQMQLLERENLVRKITEQLNETNSELTRKTEAYTDLEKNHLELIEDCTKLREITSNLEKDKLAFESYEEKVGRLEAHINTLQNELKASKDHHGMAEEDKKQFESERETLTKTISDRNEDIEELRKNLEAGTENFVKIHEEHTNVLIQLKDLQEKVRLSELKEDAMILEKNECGLLGLKLKELEKLFTSEKDKCIEFSQENIELKTKLKELEEECKRKVQNLQQLQEQYEKENRLSELKENAMMLEKNECGLLELKLKELEETLKSNLESFAKEHESISRDLECISKELNLAEEEESRFTQGGLKLKLDILKDVCTKKNQENKDLLSIQSDLKQENASNLARVEKLYSQITNTNNDYQIKIQSLQDSINENNDLLKEDQDKIRELEELFTLEKDKCIEFSQENIELTTKLKELEEECKRKLQNLQQLQEQYEKERNVFEETAKDNKDKCIEFSQENIELKTKLKGLEEEYKRKLQNLQIEHQRLQEQYEKEKILFEETAKDNKDKCIEFSQENIELKIKLNVLEEECKRKIQNLQQLQEQYEKEKNVFEETAKDNKNSTENLKKLEETIKKVNDEKCFELQELTAANEKLILEKEREISKLSSDISNLSDTIEKQNVEFNKLLVKTQELDAIVEKIRIEKSDAIKLEKDQQNQLNLKIEDSNKEAEQRSKEIVDLRQYIAELERSYKEEKAKHDDKLVEYTEIEFKLKNQMDELKAKNQEIYILNTERDSLLEEITTLRSEIGELTVGVSQKGNLDTKQEEEILELNKRIRELSLDNRNVMEENQILSQEKEELKIAFELLKEEQTIEKLKIEDLTVKITNLQGERKLSASNEADIVKIQQDFYEIKEKCDDLFIENKNLKLEYGTLEEKCNSFGKIKEKLETQINDSERHYNELLREKELLADEVQELKTAPVNYKIDTSRLDNLETLKKEQNFLKDSEKQHYLKELDVLRDKLTKYKSLDLTNKSSIEFYENELQKMKNQNDKLNRKLDETIVTLNHCAELSTSTEVEYLRNVLYNYMLGKESLVLARVIAAVCKFDPQQTEMILQKEQQKQTLLGHLGLI